MVKFIHHVVEGLAYLHQRKIAHLDIKVSTRNVSRISKKNPIKKLCDIAVTHFVSWNGPRPNVACWCVLKSIRHATHEQTNGHHDLDSKDRYQYTSISSWIKAQPRATGRKSIISSINVE